MGDLKSDGLKGPYTGSRPSSKRDLRINISEKVDGGVVVR